MNEEIISKYKVLDSLEKKLDDIEKYKQAFAYVYTFSLSEDEKRVADKVSYWMEQYIDNLFEWERKIDRGENPYKVYQEYTRFPDGPQLNENERKLYSNLNLTLIWSVIL